MADWWNLELSTLQQVMFVIGVAMGVVLVIQIVMMLIGMGHDTTFETDGGFSDGGGHGCDHDHDGHGDVFNNDGAAAFAMRMLSVRSIIAFLGIGSWVCFIMLDHWPVWGAVLLAVGCGIAAAAVMAFAMQQMQKLQSAGNVLIENAVGKNGEVYLRIPNARTGRGKIQISVQERLREYDAVTDSTRPIKTGERIKVTATVDENTLLVEPV